jgi:hypothetical protein
MQTLNVRLISLQELYAKTRRYAQARLERPKLRRASALLRSAGRENQEVPTLTRRKFVALLDECGRLASEVQDPVRENA